MGQNPAAGSIYGIYISPVTKIHVPKHRIQSSTCKHFFQDLRSYAHLHQAFVILAGHADVLHDHALRHIHLGFLCNLDGRILHDHHESVGLLPALHVKAYIGINGASYDNPFSVNDM